LIKTIYFGERKNKRVEGIGKRSNRGKLFFPDLKNGSREQATNKYRSYTHTQEGRQGPPPGEIPGGPIQNAEREKRNDALNERATASWRDGDVLGVWASSEPKARRKTRCERHRRGRRSNTN